MTKQLLLSELLTEEQCAERVTAADIAAVEAFVSATRRREFLTWRAMLYEYLGRPVEIVYEAGAPIVVGHNIYIGVSHTTDMAAVVVSDSRCAVDIERADRDLSRVAARFFTDRERQLAAECGNGEVVIWCARECYYKFRRDKGLDILADICVTDMDLCRGEIVVEDSRGEDVKMKIEQTAEHIVVYVL